MDVAAAKMIGAGIACIALVGAGIGLAAIRHEAFAFWVVEMVEHLGSFVLLGAR